MDFKLILQNLLEKAIAAFNSGDYNALDGLIVKHVEFTAPKYSNSIVNEAAVSIMDKEALFNYWKKMHTNYPFVIDEIEYLEIGKTSKFRNTMKDFGYIIDAEIHFNEYGKVIRIFNTISDEVPIK